MLRQVGDRETIISTVGRDGFSTLWPDRLVAGKPVPVHGGTGRRLPALSATRTTAPTCTGPDGPGRRQRRTFELGNTLPRWKGRLGPGADGKYLVRQMGVMVVNSKQVVVSMAAIPDDGTFESGASMLSAIARSVASPGGRVSARLAADCHRGGANQAFWRHRVWIAETVIRRLRLEPLPKGRHVPARKFKDGNSSSICAPDRSGFTDQPSPAPRLKPPLLRRRWPASARSRNFGEAETPVAQHREPKGETSADSLVPAGT